MATLLNIINLVQCGLNAALGTGLKGCKPFFKKATSMWLTPQGFEYDSTQILDETYVKLLQSQGDLIVVKGIRTFTDNTPEDNIETLDDGTKQTNALALYDFALQFVNGLYFHAALTSLNSFGAYDATFIDRDGNILGTKSVSGSLKGFTIGQLQAAPLKFATDTTGQKEGLMLQLLERSEMDSEYVYIQRKQLNFNPNRIDGVNEIVLTFVNPPTALDVLLTLKAVRKQDGGAFTGADFNDFNLKINGSTDDPTAGDDTVLAGTYPLTITALALDDTLDVGLYDTANNRPVVTIDGDNYQSKTLIGVTT